MSNRKSKLAAGLLIVFILVVLVAGLAALAWWMGREEVPKRTILEVDIEEAMVEYVPTSDPFAALLMEDTMQLRDFVEAIHAAADDEHVVALVARVAPVGMGLAQIEELRDAVKAFREAGKPAVAFADTYGELIGGNSAYYLASAFDEVYVQPSGDVGLTGLMIQSPFVNGTLEKIGVDAYWSTRYEYKTAGNMFTEQEFTQPERQALDALLGSIYDHMMAEIAGARGMSETELRALVDRGPILGPEAEEVGLVDGLYYRNQVYDRVRELARGGGAGGSGGDGGDGGDGGAGEEAGGTDTGGAENGDDARLLYLSKYAKRAEGPYDQGDHTLALVYAVGAVQRGESSYDPFNGSFVMGSESVSAALRSAIDDDEVEAIVLRVDSPGGSYVASDSIWHEVERAQEAGKPVVVSMGNLAASGGYFVSMGADRIVAHPTTITGSIGVLGGKFDTRDMWNRLGITFDQIQYGDHADMWSAVEPFDESEWETFNAWLDRVYEDFTGKVAEGRGMTQEEVHAVAKGRVWSGADALEAGLVDELGGLPAAIRLAREAAGIDAEAGVRLRQYPRRQSPWDALFGEGPESSESAAARAAMALVVERVRPVVRMAYRAGLLDEPGVLRARGVTVEGFE